MQVFYNTPDVIYYALKNLTETYGGVRGLMHWDSHWDRLNGYKVSTAAADALGIKPISDMSYL